MSLPRVSILFDQGNLLAPIQAIDGIAGIICSGTATAGMPLKTPRQIFSLKDLEALGVTNEYTPAVSGTEGSPGQRSTSEPMVIEVVPATGTNIMVLYDGDMVLAVYTTTADDSTPNALAQSIRQAVNSGTSGFNAIGSFASIEIQAPLSLGSSPNGNNVQIQYMPVALIAFMSGGQDTTPAIPDTPEVDNRHLYHQVSEFYAAVGGSQELWVMTVPNTVTMTQMLDKNPPDHAQHLINVSGGRIKLLGVCRQPDAEYNPGTQFIDADVANALPKAKDLAELNAQNLKFFRTLIEGRVANADSTNIFEPKAALNDYAGVVLGGSIAGPGASVGLVLGRACRYGAHIKIGKVANGPLPINIAYIGPKPVTEYSNLAFIHGLGYISFCTHPGKAGIYLGIDRMTNQGDYRLLAYGRLADKAATIAAAVYLEVLESELELELNGQLSPQEVGYLTAIISQQIRALMGAQISNHQVLIAADQNIVNTGVLEVELRLQPLGYASFIQVKVGLTASIG
ncbi:MAG TPA: DUF2586 family protein [Phnomibacter sp.]|nr:DUF2586 family protein [Phnomibacter sp.]